MESYFSPLFMEPFEIPKFPALMHYHNMMLHFPIALLILCWMSDAGRIFTKRQEPQMVSKTVFPLALFFLALTYLTGQISSHRKAFSLGDPDWVQKNAELSTSIINHRGLATLTLLAFLAIALIRYGVRRLSTDQSLIDRVDFISLTLGIPLLALTAHLGGNISV